MASLEVTLYGQFWVTPEDKAALLIFLAERRSG
jgi:hypothetical protein